MALKVALEVLGVKTLCLHLFKLLVVIVDTLTACCDLQTSEKKVELAGCSGVFLVVHCIERRLGRGEVCYKDKLCTVVLLCPVAEEHLVLRLQVKLVLCLAALDKCNSVLELYCGYLGDLRDICIQYLYFICIVFLQVIHQVAEHCGLHIHNVVHIVDEAHLKVKTDVLVQVT